MRSKRDEFPTHMGSVWEDRGLTTGDENQAEIEFDDEIECWGLSDTSVSEGGRPLAMPTSGQIRLAAKIRAFTPATTAFDGNDVLWM